MSEKIIGLIDLLNPNKPTTEVSDYLNSHNVKLVTAYIGNKIQYSVEIKDYLKYVSHNEEFYGSRSGDRKTSITSVNGKYTLNGVRYTPKILFGYSEDIPNKILVIYRTEHEEIIEFFDNNIRVENKGTISKWNSKRKFYTQKNYSDFDYITTDKIVRAKPVFRTLNDGPTFAELLEQSFKEQEVTHG